MSQAHAAWFLHDFRKEQWDWACMLSGTDIFWSTTKPPLAARSLSEMKNPFLKGQVSPRRATHNDALTPLAYAPLSPITSKEIQRSPSKCAARGRPLLLFVQILTRALSLQTNQTHLSLPSKEVIYLLISWDCEFSSAWNTNEKPHTKFNLVQ